jgi:hypothetical protein
MNFVGFIVAGWIWLFHAVFNLRDKVRYYIVKQDGMFYVESGEKFYLRQFETIEQAEQFIKKIATDEKRDNKGERLLVAKFNFKGEKI